ncbi:MAG: class I SAM-dependent methyltransferase [Oscillospiraceae bacterium]|nr:class I SAM-dependent methyltransferase [Oscillospiraceae bacterium]
MKIIKTDIDNGKAFDWGMTSENYAKFRDIYPESFYEKVVEMGLCIKDQCVLDLGTGTGVLPRHLRKYGAEFVGADISENQIEQAEKLSAGMGIKYIVSPAETVDFPDGFFDVVTACQCYAYFDKDAIFGKIHKILKINGVFCIIYVMYLPNESPIAAKSEELILKYNPSWSASGATRFTYDFPGQAAGLFTLDRTFLYDISIPFTRESWHGRMMTCRGIGASDLTAREVAQWEVEHRAYLETAPQEFDVPHFVTGLVLRKLRAV